MSKFVEIGGELVRKDAIITISVVFETPSGLWSFTVWTNTLRPTYSLRPTSTKKEAIEARAALMEELEK